MKPVHEYKTLGNHSDLCCSRCRGDFCAARYFAGIPKNAAVKLVGTGFNDSSAIFRLLRGRASVLLFFQSDWIPLAHEDPHASGN
jgi:hypothetical protein